MDQREAIVRAAHALHAQGLLAGTSGNISARAGERILVTPSGVPWPEVDVGGIAEIAHDGTPVAGPIPSSEAPLHASIYAARPEVRAIVHTHSHYATVFSVLRRPIPAVHYLIAFAGRSVQVADYACYGTSALADAAVRALGSARAVLLANHGVVAIGGSLDEACTVAAAVEEVAALAYHASLLGAPVVLSDAELGEVEGRFATYGRQVG